MSASHKPPSPRRPNSTEARSAGRKPPRPTWASRLATSTLNRPDDSLAEAAKALQLDPNSSRAFNIQGKAWMKKRDYRKAVDSLQRSVDLHPEFESAYALGVSLLSLNDPESKKGRVSVRHDRCCRWGIPAPSMCFLAALIATPKCRTTPSANFAAPLLWIPARLTPITFSVSRCSGRMNGPIRRKFDRNS